MQTQHKVQEFLSLKTFELNEALIQETWVVFSYLVVDPVELLKFTFAMQMASSYKLKNLLFRPVYLIS